jgi:hypothetical protein
VLSASHRFELRRRVDGLVYGFTRAERPDGQPGYRRDDRDLWIVRCPRRGWIAVDPDTGAVTGRPWLVEPADQGDAPPEGVWVSSKGDKAYVYDLVHVAARSRSG